MYWVGIGGSGGGRSGLMDGGGDLCGLSGCACRYNGLGLMYSMVG